MENSKNYIWVNLSNKRRLEKINYDDMPYNNFPESYKPKYAFWGARESKNKNYYSTFDEMYDVSSDNDIKTANYFKYGENTQIVSAADFQGEIHDALVQFYRMIDNKSLRGKLPSDELTRKLLLEFLKDKGVIDRNVEHLIYQIDLVEDENLIEEMCGYTGAKSSDETVKKLPQNFVRALRRGFSGVEVTDFALGRSEEALSFGIEEAEEYKMINDPRYENCGLGAWDTHSVAIFDMNAIDLIRTININKKAKDQKEEREL